jgi:hypothetical protein
MKDYCDAVKQRKEEIEKHTFRVGDSDYSAKIMYPGITPLISMKKQGNCESILFIVQDSGIKEGNPKNPNSTHLKNQLEIILNGREKV